MACDKVLVPFGNILLKSLVSGLPQAPFDPCLFIGQKVFEICYSNDLIFWARNEQDIVELAIQLWAKGVASEQEDDSA